MYYRFLFLLVMGIIIQFIPVFYAVGVVTIFLSIIAMFIITVSLIIVKVSVFLLRYDCIAKHFKEY